MKKITAGDLRNLEHGEQVWRSDGYSVRSLRFVGIMPGNPNYIILCDGEYLTHLYISPKNDDDGEDYRGEWYSGEYDSKFVGEIMLKYHQEKIESIQSIYLKEDE